MLKKTLSFFISDKKEIPLISDEEHECFNIETKRDRIIVWYYYLIKGQDVFDEIGLKMRINKYFGNPLFEINTAKEAKSWLTFLYNHKISDGLSKEEYKLGISYWLKSLLWFVREKL
ncbi:hypothetical protein A4G19_10585 [Pasteurellaceae bacterium Macca]|nr:hypothetical protein [Pasteurellaceae bacterium Macca]MCK3656170.1 hypothetical protein [Pasteurellaceae bacterium Macca]